MIKCSAEGTRRSFRRITNMTALEIEATERYRLTSLTLTIFWMNEFLVLSLARVLRKSGHSDCIDNQADLVVNDMRV